MDKRTSALLVAALLVMGCTGLDLRTRGQGHQSAGLQVPMAKPYLLVTAKGESGSEMRIVYLPDFQNSYSVKPKGWLGAGTFHVELTSEGFLRSIAGATVEESSVPVPSPFSRDDGGAGRQAVPGSAPAPGLYEIVPDAPTESVKLHRVPFEPADLVSPFPGASLEPKTPVNEAISDDRRPTAEISFGTLQNGMVSTIAVSYHAHSGDCVLASSPMELRSGEVLDKKTDYKMGPPHETEQGCLAGVTLQLTPARTDIAVSVVPHSRANLWGDMVFAATQAPLPPPSPRVAKDGGSHAGDPHPEIKITQPPPQVLVLDQRNPGGPPMVVLIEPKDPAKPPVINSRPPQPAEPAPIKLLAVQARIRNKSFSGFAVKLQAGKSLSEWPQVRGWTTSQKAKWAADHTIGFQEETVGCSEPPNTLVPVSIQSLRRQAKDNTQVSLELAVNRPVSKDERVLRAERILHIEIEVEKREKRCLVLEADTSHLRRLQEEESQSNAGGKQKVEY